MLQRVKTTPFSGPDGTRRFDRTLEDAYQKALLEDKTRAFIQTNVLAVLLYAGFGYLDMWGLPGAYRDAWAVRAGVIGVTLLSSLLATQQPARFLRWYGLVVGSLYFGWGAGIVAIIQLSAPGEFAWDSYYAGLLLVSMGLYTCTYLSPAVACTVGFSLTFAYILGAMLGQNMGYGEGRVALLGNCFFLLSANVIGIVSLDIRERFARKAFLLESGQGES